VVDGVLAKGVGQVLASVRGYYRAVLTEVLREESLWFQARKQAIAKGQESPPSAQTPGQAAELRARISRIGDLRQEIANSMKGGQP
jgi:hypothetical protein